MSRRGVLGAMLAGDLVFAGAHVFDGTQFLEGPHDVLVRDGRLDGIEQSLSPIAGLPRRDGGFLFPGFVDAHVHLSFSDPEAVVRGGVTTVLDLGAPLDYAFAPHPPVRFRFAGPLLTAPRGYPTKSWGAGGYGLEMREAASARDAVAKLADRGAAIIKLAIEPSEGPLPAADTLRAAVDAAHARRLLVAAHALGVDSVRVANDAGVDVLAHTPIEPIPSDLVRALADRGVVVISTVAAFGARRSTRDNLAALAAAGCPIAYGTDLGNGRIQPGIDVEELAIIEEAVGGRAPALAAATSVAGSLAGRGGRLAVGSPADLIWIPSFTEPADLRRGLEVRMGA